MGKEFMQVEESTSIPEVRDERKSSLDKRIVFLMAVASAMAAANVYYVQPLLENMGHTFNVSAGQIGLVATLCQVGYACGLLFIIPLGDSYNQRKMIVGMLIAVTVALIIMAIAPSMTILLVASFLVGLTTIVPQIILPFAANLASDRNRGQVVGTVQSGLLIGLLLSRAVSGFIAAQFGWRAMYWLAAGLMALLVIVLYFFLPEDRVSKHHMHYFHLMRSLGDLLRDEPILREASLFGALSFGAFSAFWVTLSFFLARPPFHFGSEVAGLFGLVGVAGALAATFVGKLADRRDPRFASGVGMLIALLSFVLMWFTGQWIAGLIVGVIFLDLGVQGNHVTNQFRIYGLRGEVRNRLNTVYMTSYFIGGSLGSVLGIYGWSVAGWAGVCGIAVLMYLIALVVFVLNRKRMRSVRSAV